MSIFKIAWRSVQHRGLGSLLTILSMALGVMMVVAVLSIHGLVSQSFKNNNSFGYNMLVGARGGGMQLTMNTVYYLSAPVENVPYEYYLAFVDEETRTRELQTSFAVMAMQNELSMLDAMTEVAGGPGGPLVSAILLDEYQAYQSELMGLNKKGIYTAYTDIAVPLCLGDYWEAPNSELNFRCVGTKPDFFEKLVLDIDTREKFKFAEGRNFESFNKEHGFFECVIGSQIAKRGGAKIGDRLNPTHGDPNSSGAHLHEQGFTVVGVLERTGTPNDRVVFLNIEGFYLMEDHVKPIEDDSLLGGNDDEGSGGVELDLFADEEDEQGSGNAAAQDSAAVESTTNQAMKRRKTSPLIQI